MRPSNLALQRAARGLGVDASADLARCDFMKEVTANNAVEDLYVEP